MVASTSNPLLSSQKSSELQAILHPLVLLTISDYITRHTLREQQGPIIGVMLGQQNGRDITIEHAIEAHVRSAPEVPGGYLLDDDRFRLRLEQMIAVHKDRQLDLVGWYTLLPPSGPTPTILPIHKQILEFNESAILLGFHPTAVLDHSVGGKLPLTIYESNYEVDDSKAENDGEDKKMDDGEPIIKLKFKELPYSVETDETEMISMNYVTGASGNAAAANKEERPSRSVESNGKGKRRLVESEEYYQYESGLYEDINLSIEDDEMLAALTAKVNATKMLHSRIRLLTTYLEQLPPSFVSGEKTAAEPMEFDQTTPSQNVLRQIQALISRFDLVIPSDEAAFDEEVQRETNDVNMLNLLNDMMQGLNKAREVGKKYSVVENAKASSRREPDFRADSNYMRGPGDLLM